MTYFITFLISMAGMIVFSDPVEAFGQPEMTCTRSQLEFADIWVPASSTGDCFNQGGKCCSDIEDGANGHQAIPGGTRICLFCYRGDTSSGRKTLLHYRKV